MTSEETFYPDKLIKLFTIFVIGTTSLWLYFYLQLPNFTWKSGLRFTLFLTGFYSYIFVIFSLSSYYILQAKKKFVSSFEKKKQYYFRISVLILGISYIFFDTIIEKSIWVFLRDSVMVLLILFTIPKIDRWVDKKLRAWNKKQYPNKSK